MAAIPPLGLQLYTLRDALAADYEGTLRRIAEIGYRIVEPFDVVSQAEELKTGLAAAGLEAKSTHLNFLREGTDVEAAFATVAGLGIGTLIEPFVAPENWTSVEGIRGTAERLNGLVESAGRHGLRLGYHNHAFELKNMFAGRTALEVLAEHLDPAVVLELDTYWAAAGGQDVLALLDRLGDRVRFLHVKDGPIEEDAASQVAVGSGAMPIMEILEAARHVEVAVIELDEFRGDMWEAVADSYAYLEGKH